MDEDDLDSYMASVEANTAGKLKQAAGFYEVAGVEDIQMEPVC